MLKASVDAKFLNVSKIVTILHTDRFCHRLLHCDFAAKTSENNGVVFSVNYSTRTQQYGTSLHATRAVPGNLALKSARNPSPHS